MNLYWISINGGEGFYINGSSFADAVQAATFMNPTVTTLTIEDHTEEEACPT